MPDTPRGGRLVVATPSLVDPNFRHTVVLLLEHGDDGAVGVVVNRPSEVAVGDALPGWERFAADPPVVFVGGPVQQDALIGLARRDTGPPPQAWQALSDELGVVNLDQDPLLVDGLGKVRVFAGYAGWGPGQLENEIAAGSWFVLDADPHDPFAADTDQLWQGVVRRQGGMFATFPPDPSHN